MAINFRWPQFFKAIRFGNTLVWVDPSGEIKTVTGSLPLTLENTISKSVISLIQYGVCEYGLNPTPDSPNSITCNNGILRLVDDELPEGYRRLQDIKFDGNTWYETNDYLTGEDNVTMTLAQTISSGQNVFGSYNGTTSGRYNFSLYVYGGGSTSNSYFRYGEQLVRPSLGSGERTITFGRDGTSGFERNVTLEPDTFTTPSNVYIGMLPNSSSPEYTGAIVGNIVVGTRLKYIPCERISDGTIGYYEIFNDQFVEPSGTGEPTTKGYDGSHLVFTIEGTSEVLTVGDSTASVSNLFAVDNYKDEQNIVTGAIKRKVQVKVLDGTEDMTYSSSTGEIAISFSDIINSSSEIVCSHYPNELSGDYYCNHNQADSNVYFYDVACESEDDYHTKFADKYAAGTPVIIIYPLETETSEQVAAQSIRTKKGTTTVSATSELTTIDVEIEYYKASE